MTLTTPYSASFYVGDGETKAFSFIFEELNADFVKVIVSHADGTTTVPTYTVDLDLKQVVFGDETPAPTADDVVCIYRQTPTIQDTPFRTLEGYNAKALENILSKIVAMIQEIKSTYFSTQVLQGDPWQLDLLTSADDGATVNIDYTAKKLVKGLYFKIVDGNLKVSADDSNYITMPKSVDVAEFRQTEVVLPDLSVVYKLEYRVGNTWYDAGAVAEEKAEEAIRIAEEARDIANDAKDIAEDAKETAESVEGIAQEAKDIALESNDRFNNGDIINQIPQNGLAFPVFRRDGDYMLFVGWGDTSLSLEGGIYNVDEIVLSHRIYVDLPVFQSALQNKALLSSNDDIHQYLVPYYSTHCSMFIPKQNTIQKNIWTPLYSDQNTSSIVAYIKTNNIVSPLNPGISASSTPDDSVLVYFPLLGQTESDAVNVCLVRHKIY